MAAAQAGLRASVEQRRLKRRNAAMVFTMDYIGRMLLLQVDKAGKKPLLRPPRWRISRGLVACISRHSAGVLDPSGQCRPPRGLPSAQSGRRASQ